MEFVLGLQNLQAPEEVEPNAAAGGMYLQSDMGSYTCYGCSWLFACVNE